MKDRVRLEGVSSYKYAKAFALLFLLLFFFAAYTKHHGFNFVASALLSMSMLPLGFAVALALVDKVSKRVANRLQRAEWRAARGWVFEFLILNLKLIVVNLAVNPLFAPHLDKYLLQKGFSVSLDKYDKESRDALLAALEHLRERVLTVIDGESDSDGRVSSSATTNLAEHLEESKYAIDEIRQHGIPRLLIVQANATEFGFFSNLDHVISSYRYGVSLYEHKGLLISNKDVANFVVSVCRALYYSLDIYFHPENVSERSSFTEGRG